MTLEEYIGKINDFRVAFNLPEEEYSNEQILDLLKENNFDFDKAFWALLD